jgi:hypothetical protein
VGNLWKEQDNLKFWLWFSAFDWSNIFNMLVLHDEKVENLFLQKILLYSMYGAAIHQILPAPGPDDGSATY